MELGTISDVIVAVAAVAALILSIYNYRLQKQGTRPSLRVSSDTRVERGLGIIIYSCRVVNDGHVPVEIRTLRIILGKNQTLPMPATDEEMEFYLWQNERTLPTSPTVLQPGQSVRFATSKDQMDAALRSAGFTAIDVEYEVAVVDALDNIYTVEELAALNVRDPEP